MQVHSPPFAIGDECIIQFYYFHTNIHEAYGGCNFTGNTMMIGELATATGTISSAGDFGVYDYDCWADTFNYACEDLVETSDSWFYEGYTDPCPPCGATHSDVGSGDIGRGVDCG